MSEAGSIACDTGPLIALSAIEHLDLLPRLYTRVVAPRAVIDELRAGGEGRPVRSFAEADWLEIAEDVQPEPLLAAELGAGEAATIAFAARERVSLVLLDDRRARRIADQAYGLRVKGTAGVLVAARRAGLVTRVRPLLQAMTANGYYLSPRLIEAACAAAGESGDAPEPR